MHASLRRLTACAWLAVPVAGAWADDAPVPDVSNAAVRPILECVAYSGNATYTAHFGYKSDNTVAVSIPVGANNRFSPLPQDRGQPSTFQPGRTSPFPNSAFQVAFNGSSLVWTLKGPDGSTRTSTASSSSPRCSCSAPPPAPAPVPGQPGSYEGPGSSAKVTLAGASETGFAAAGAALTFRLSCPTLSTRPNSMAVYDNDTPLALSGLVSTANSVTLPGGLTAGRHDLLFVASDVYGAVIRKRAIVWAGSTSIPVEVLDEAGAPVANATVKLALADDAKVGATLITNASGQGTFANLPDRSYNIVATASGNRIGSKPHSFVDGTAVVRLRGFKPASTIDNNDFSLGTQGWEVGTAPVAIIPHVEGSPLTLDAPPVSARAGKRRLRTLADSERLALELSAARAEAANADFDLQLATSGEGPQFISRTFAVPAGAASVRLRFRFITSEVPGGYFGTEFNDFFNVSVRSQQAGGQVNVGNSMNGLGLEAFDAGGATGWYEAELPVAATGDTVQFDMSVANVADGLLDSWLVADALRVTSLNVEAVELLDIDNAPLEYVSAAAHTYFGGNLRFNGTIRLRGPASATLESLTLRIKRGGTTIATGELPAALRPSVLTTFGSDQTISVGTRQLLFEVPSSGLGIGDGTNQRLTLEVYAATAAPPGATAADFVAREVTTLTRLTRYNNANRYGGRDEATFGGDDWLLPTVRTVVGQVASATWGDFSNMHGGSFEPDHSSHRDGTSADGWIDGYDRRDADVAQRLIDIVNALGRRIRLCYVTFTTAFANAISGVTLADGRAATQVFLDLGDHADHFHFEVTP